MKQDEPKEEFYSKIEVLALVRALKQRIKDCKREKDMDTCSFGYEKGVLITGNDAIYCLNSIQELQQLKEQLQAKEKTIKAAFKFINGEFITDEDWEALGGKKTKPKN